MSGLETKDLKFYLIIVLVTGGSYFLNDTNVGVTEDKIEAIDDTNLKQDNSIQALFEDSAKHEAKFAHAGIDERTEQQQDQLDKLEERVTYLERHYLNGNNIME